MNTSESCVMLGLTLLVGLVTGGAFVFVFLKGRNGA